MTDVIRFPGSFSRSWLMFHARACIANLDYMRPHHMIGYMDCKTCMQLFKFVSTRNVESPLNHAHVHVYRCLCVLDILIKDIYIYTRVYIYIYIYTYIYIYVCVYIYIYISIYIYIYICVCVYIAGLDLGGVVAAKGGLWTTGENGRG